MAHADIIRMDNQQLVIPVEAARQRHTLNQEMLKYKFLKHRAVGTCRHLSRPSTAYFESGNAKI
jgi:hypothetical protein